MEHVITSMESEALTGSTLNPTRASDEVAQESWDSTFKCTRMTKFAKWHIHVHVHVIAQRTVQIAVVL